MEKSIFLIQWKIVAQRANVTARFGDIETACGGRFSICLFLIVKIE